MYRISNGAFAGCAALLPNRCQIWQISYGFQDEDGDTKPLASDDKIHS